MSQPVMRGLTRRLADRMPGIFDRLGPHQNCRFLIDPKESPVVFLLVPSRERPDLRTFPRSRMPAHDACIAGPLRHLTAMVDGREDGDALFFSRDLQITGNLEAVVCLRNALDDMDGTAMDRVADVFGMPGRLVLALMRKNGARPKPETRAS